MITQTPLILFENDDFLVLDKPSGLVMHPFDFSSEETLLDFLIKRNPNIFTIIQEKQLQDNRVINLGGIVHKLDRDTSGIVVVAKNKDSYKELSSLFKNHHVQKTYRAVVFGILEKDSFTIDAPLGREKKGYRQVVNPVQRRGELRSAITDVRVLKRNETTTLVELSPQTGRTHQLRAHMFSLGHPICGDKVYSLAGKVVDERRLMLHAEKITFSLFGKEYTFETKIPTGF